MTLFTAVTWTDGGIFSYSVTSDTLFHDKYTAATFLEAVIDNLQAKMATLITEFDIFSDGAAQQFKLKYMFMWASSLLEKKQIHVN